MSSVLASAERPFTTCSVPTAGGCAHCGEALPTGLTDTGGEAFCCEGCAAAAQWIRSAQLGDFYRLRQQASGRVGTDKIDLSAWDRDDILQQHAHRVGNLREITLLASGMHCAACAWLIDRALSREPGVIDASANAVTGRIRLLWDPQLTVLSRPLQRLLALGFRPYLAAGEIREKARRSESRRTLLRLGLAALGSMQAMMFAEALYLDFSSSMPLPTRDFFRWITFLVSTPVVFYAGWPFLHGAWQELRRRQLGMDGLIAGSTLLAWLASSIETLRGGPHVWFDAAVMFVFLLLMARSLEQHARSIASAQVDALARARPLLAVRERPDGIRETVPIAALVVGDIVCVAVDETLPADGLLLDEFAWFEEALLSGEAQPVRHRRDEAVFAGTLCRDCPTRLRVTAVGSATRLSQLTRLVEKAQSEKPATARFADRIAGYFVISLLVTAVLVYFAWRVLDPSRAFEVTLAMLVISCPCALSLAVPAAVASAHGALAKLGVLAVRDGALDRLASVTDVVFDKTGTLSDGHPRIVGCQTSADLSVDQACAIAAALEQGSRHPIARAFASYAPVQDVEAIRAVAGAGIEGRYQGRVWRLGQASFAGAASDDGQLWMAAIGARQWARFCLQEAQREDASVALQTLRDLGLHLHLCSGDAALAVADFAARLGIESSHSRQSPEDKLAFVKCLQNQGRRVAMVGDGLNDAPVLAGADVSLAIADGSALAQSAADLVLTGPSLQRIPQAMQLARKTRRIIRQNLCWAVGYNLLALPLAALGQVTPWMAALGMAMSSLLVTLNALRLTRLPRA